MMPYLVGHAHRSITPELPVFLAGYDKIRQSNYVHDPLYAKAIVIQDAGQPDSKAAIISLDTYAVDEAFTQLIVGKLARYGLTRSQIVLNATHTHSGPSGLCSVDETILAGLERIFGQYNVDYANYCAEQIEWCIYEAMQNLQESRLVAFQGRLTNLPWHAQGKETQADSIQNNDTAITFLEFRFDCFQPILIYSFAYHNDCLSHENLGISADLISVIEEVLIAKDNTPSKSSNENQTKDQYGMVLYLCGALPNKRNRSSRNVDMFEEMHRIGTMIGHQIQAILKDESKQVLPKETALPIDIQSITYHIPLLSTPTPSQINNQLLLFERLWVKKSREASSMEWQKVRHIYASYIEGTKIRKQMIEHMVATQATWPIIKLSLGGFSFLTIPGGMYESLAKQVNLEAAFIVGYTNGYLFTMIDDDGHENLDFESLVSPYRRGEGERFTAFLNEALAADMVKQ